MFNIIVLNTNNTTRQFITNYRKIPESAYKIIKRGNRSDYEMKNYQGLRGITKNYERP